VLDVAAGHGDAGVVTQAIDQGIRRGLFQAADVAPAAAYVAAAQGWGTPIRGSGGYGTPLPDGDAFGHGDGEGYGVGHPDGSGYGGGVGSGAGFGDGSGYGGGQHGWGLAGLGDRFYARPFSGTCTAPPPSDWPTLAAEIGVLSGAVLRVAVLPVQDDARGVRLADRRGPRRVRREEASEAARDEVRVGVRSPEQFKASVETRLRGPRIPPADGT
jgi:hypothetical protein